MLNHIFVFFLLKWRDHVSKTNPSTQCLGFIPLQHNLGHLFCHWFHSFSLVLWQSFFLSTPIFTSKYRYYVMSPPSKKNFLWLHNSFQLVLHFSAPIYRNTHTQHNTHTQRAVYIHYLTSFPTLFKLLPNKLCYPYTMNIFLSKSLIASRSWNPMVFFIIPVLDKLIFYFSWCIFLIAL